MPMAGERIGVVVDLEGAGHGAQAADARRGEPGGGVCDGPTAWYSAAESIMATSATSQLRVEQSASERDERWGVWLSDTAEAQQLRVACRAAGAPSMVSSQKCRARICTLRLRDRRLAWSSVTLGLRAVANGPKKTVGRYAIPRV